MSSRIENIYARLEQENLDGLILSSSPNISYLTEFISRDAYLIISKKENIYITDSRYTEEAKYKLSASFKIKRINRSVFKRIADICRALKLKRIGFEERHLTFGEHAKIKKELGGKPNLIPIYGLVEELRQIKSGEELAKMRKAAEITIAALKFAQNFLAPGKREIEVAGELQRFIRYYGAFNCAFDIIVASGPNSSFPHHLTGQRKIESNEPVLIDIGVDYFGYKSDLTRVFFLGKITLLARKIYDIVLKAQEEAIKQVRPGLRINKLDALARNYIAGKGFSKFFGHNLGHGVGLEIHEDPHISSKEKGKLKAGMVFTVEPAIYLPYKFGIRIEDMLLVTKEGAEILSGALDK